MEYSQPQIIRRKLDELRLAIYDYEEALRGWETRIGQYVGEGAYAGVEPAWTAIDVGDTWVPAFHLTRWFRRRVEVPAALAGRKIWLDLNVGGEGLVRVDGSIASGLSSYSFGSLMDRSRVLLCACAKGGESFEVEIEATLNYGEANMRRLEGAAELVYTFEKAKLAVVNDEAEGAWFDLHTAFEAMQALKNPIANLTSSALRLDGEIEGAIEAVSRDTYVYGKVADAVVSAITVIDYDMGREALLANLPAARAALREKLGAIGAQGHALIRFVGQAHIDTAWLWPMRESIRKTGRTFANALALMDQYPEFVFAFSQPQLFEFAKEHYPELYERVRQRVAEGRVELVGNAWVEMDTNIPSGESLVRQLLYGRAFYLREFGKASDVYYMPDVFGYSWSLPQIIRRSGGKYFYTSKIMYNDTNRFPHSLFNWQGVDGTRVLAYMQRLNYNGRYNPGTIDQLYKRFDEKCVSENLLMTFGFGDGGGGPDYAMLESGRRLRSFPGLQKTMCGTSADFFAANEGVRDRLPLWNDEMYFEMHRGTQTTQARTKKNNRESELLYRRAEIAASQAMAWAGAGSPNGELLPGYKRLLANQFHDILPGSSIAEVYAEAEGDYARIRRIGEGALSRARQAVLGKVAHEAGDIAVFNSLSWEHRGFVSVECGPGPGAETGAGLWPGPDCVAVVNRATGEISACEQVEKDGERRLCFEAAVPPMGCAVYARADGAGSAASAGERAANGAGLVAGAAESTPPTASVAPIAPVAPTASAAHVAPIARSISHLENDCLSVRFGEDGEIASIYDKEARREVLAAPSNILRLYEDKPARSNAWDIDIEYRNKSWLALPSEAPRLIHNSPLLAVLRLAKAFNRSTIVQDVVLRRGSRRIDFETRVDWQEREKMLKAEFALDVLCGRATYEIQFGAIERSSYGNTSQDRARFEVCAHKWADMSEGGYGAALLNNCKYGYDAVENRLRLTLLRSTIEPDPMADVGEQRFAYSLLPHLGGWQTAGVVNAGYELNAPLEAIVCQGAAGGEASLSLIASGDRNVVIDAVKAAEDGRGLIARVYEATGSRTNACLTAGFAVAGVRECNLMEDDEREIAHSGRAFQFAIKPFEIKTFRLLY